MCQDFFSVSDWDNYLQRILIVHLKQKKKFLWPCAPSRLFKKNTSCETSGHNLESVIHFEGLLTSVKASYWT